MRPTAREWLGAGLLALVLVLLLLVLVLAALPGTASGSLVRTLAGG